MDLKFEIMPSFDLHTFCFTFLAPDRSKFSMFCPPQSWYVFHGFEINKHSKLCPPHFSFDIPTQYRSKLSMISPPWYLYYFQGFEIWKYSKFCPPHFSFLAQDGSKFSIISPPPSLYILLCIWNKFEITLLLQCLELHVSSMFTFRPIKGPKYFN